MISDTEIEPKTDSFLGTKYIGESIYFVPKNESIFGSISVSEPQNRFSSLTFVFRNIFPSFFSVTAYFFSTRSENGDC